MDEIWKPIPGYEGYYEVSNLGRVKSLDREHITSNGKHRSIKGRMLKLNLSQEYANVELNKEGHPHVYSVHRLVAMTFIPNPENKQTVNHKDGDKLNNVVDNLEWMTWSENNKHAHETGLNTTDPNKTGATAKSNAVTSRSVYCVETDQIYCSRSECARQLGIESSAINDSIRGKRTVTSHGRRYTFKDVEQN